MFRETVSNIHEVDLINFFCLLIFDRYGPAQKHRLLDTKYQKIVMCFYREKNNLEEIKDTHSKPALIGWEMYRISSYLIFNSNLEFLSAADHRDYFYYYKIRSQVKFFQHFFISQPHKLNFLAISGSKQICIDICVNVFNQIKKYVYHNLYL